MAKYSNTIEYSIKTSLDKSGLSQLQNQIRQIELSLQKISNKEIKLISEKEISDAKLQLRGLNQALSKSFNSSLGMLDLTKFKTELRESKVDITQLGNIFQKTGAQGQVLFNNLVKQIGTFDSGLKRSSVAVDKMFNTISNTVR